MIRARFTALMMALILATSAPPSVAAEYIDRIAQAGHGMLFGPEGDILLLSDDEAFELHAQLYEDAMATERERPDARLEDGIAYAFELLERPETTRDDVMFLRAMQVRMQVEMMSAELNSIFNWRNDGLQKTYMLGKNYTPQGDYVALREFLAGYWNQWIVLPYEQECAAAGVPVPPKFGAASGIWTKHGRPAHNILAPGRWLEVWTWTDPNIRGACVALSRSSSSGTLLATGIICQGAETGRSCYWDSEDPFTRNLIYWDQGAKDITDIADGFELSTCIGCHEGNDAFLVAPDDPVWCRLMRGGQPGTSGNTCGAMQGNTNGNFTLRVEGAVNQIVEPTANPIHIHSRHIPIGGPPSGLGWSNNAQPGCGGACHVKPSMAVTKPSAQTNLPSMPPNCHPNCTLP
ncbi:MAG: hypothetical protein AAGP08_14155 [Pseudomonadota bacterium]